MRILAAALALFGCSLAFAQVLPTEELRQAKNAAQRAERACDRGQADKCRIDARAAEGWLDAALAVLDPPPPEPEPPHEHEPPVFVSLTVADIVPIRSLSLADYTSPYRIPASAAPDSVGAFRLICNASHLSRDDPIAFPGQPGKSHLHMFFGNTLGDAHSTYESLRTSGESTCQGDVLNRSKYWIPALLTKASGGQVVVPDFIGLYYKRWPSSDIGRCASTGTRCAGIPAGLRAIFGTNYVQGHDQSPHVSFGCTGRAAAPLLTEIAAMCPVGSQLTARVSAPDCWNGRDLDSEDHQSHLAYPAYVNGALRCPATHPVVIPKLELIVSYAVLDGDTPATWIFSSDVQAGKAAGATFHADYMEAWEPEARLAWEAACLDKLLNCSGGDLGNGRIMKAPAGFSFAQRPHLVPVPMDGSRSEVRS